MTRYAGHNKKGKEVSAYEEMLKKAGKYEEYAKNKKGISILSCTPTKGDAGVFIKRKST